jgi:type III secretory pathway component EscV
MPLVNPPVIIQNNGITQGAVNTVNFTGDAVATVTGNVAVVNVTGGGSTSITQIEVDFGTTPTAYQTFTVLDNSVSPTSNLIVTQSGNAPTGRSADENQMDPIIFSATSGTGGFTLIASALNGPVVGKYKVNYIVG